MTHMTQQSEQGYCLQALEAHVKAHTHELATLTFTRMPFAADPYFTSRDTAPNAAAAKVRCALLPGLL